MDYYGHKDGERVQLLKDHLQGAARIAAAFAESFGKGEWGYCAGLLHDIGKYALAFLEKLEKNSDQRVDHSTAGAQVCLEKGGLYGILSYCIAGHHAGLPDYGDRRTASTLMGRAVKKVEDYQAYKQEIQIPELKTAPFDLQKTKNPDFSLSVFIRMLFSCLVDADFLDTEAFMKAGQVERDSGESMDVLFEKLKQYIHGWLENTETETINGRRTEILTHCLEKGKKEKGMFRLTVPTGGGKTIASLAFALQHAVENHMERIIYVVPYTSIIEQNAAVFRGILGKQNVLEDHCNVSYESEREKEAEEWKLLQLAVENWDKPVVVTTNVQFFESLFANKPSKCRKLHNIANSVIIFDEAQMLPNDYLVPCTAMMEELVNNYESSIVLCTATQPALTSFFQNQREITELCPRMEEQFRFFRRVRFQNLGKLGEEALTERLAQEYQALCIVNTKKSAQTLYCQLKGEGVYHLSTTMYSSHRRRMLEQIRERLKQGEKCILIATSLVEAGVDLDFQTVYRQLAGVDSLIQAAGRCNREGKRNSEESIVSVFQFPEKQRVPGQTQQIEVAEILLAEGRAPEALETVEAYFERLYHFRGESLDKKKIMEAFKDKDYQFATVAKKFKLIEEAAGTLVIPREEKAEELLQQMKNSGYTKSGMRKITQYCVQVNNRQLEKLAGAGKIRPVSADMEDFYELTEPDQYTEEMGLNLEVEEGIALYY